MAKSNVINQFSFLLSTIFTFLVHYFGIYLYILNKMPELLLFSVLGTVSETSQYAKWEFLSPLLDPSQVCILPTFSSHVIYCNCDSKLFFNIYIINIYEYNSQQNHTVNHDYFSSPTQLFAFLDTVLFPLLLIFFFKRIRIKTTTYSIKTRLYYLKSPFKTLWCIRDSISFTYLKFSPNPLYSGLIILYAWGICFINRCSLRIKIILNSYILSAQQSAWSKTIR